MQPENTGPAQARYNELRTYRDAYIQRARECAKLTIPSLFPEQETNNGATAQLKTPWHSGGARWVNNIASKLLLALFPPNVPFFRIRATEQVLLEAATEQGIAVDVLKPKVETAFSKVEREILKNLEDSAFRPVTYEALRLLTVTGNVLLHISKKGQLKVYRLDKYVVKRDPSGNVVEIVIRDDVSFSALPKEVRSILKDRMARSNESGHKDAKVIDVYTHIKRSGDKWSTYQECKGIRIPKSMGEYPLDAPPWIPLRFVRVDGEDYGRSYIEEYLGDLRTLNSLTKAITTGALGAAKQLWAVEPGSLIRPRDLQKESGSVIIGSAGDVGVLQANKNADMAVAYQEQQAIEQRLAFAFLMANPRNAERVTAEEIRVLIGMLEDALGGIYSVLSQEFQRPLVWRFIRTLENQKVIDGLPRDLIELSIVTGVESLGRNHELQRLEAYVRGIGETFGPQAIIKYVDPHRYLQMKAAALGIDTTVVRSPEEIAAREQQEMQQQMAMQVAPEVTRQVGAAMSEQ